jgi:hypothetical protein
VEFTSQKRYAGGRANDDLNLRRTEGSNRRVAVMKSAEKNIGVLVKVLTAHFKALVSAGSDATVLRQYSALLRSLKSGECKFLEEHPRASGRADRHPPLPVFSDEELRKMSLHAVEKLVNDPTVSRKALERIAIQRFSVPSGSMRSFSNTQMLLTKLRTLIENERAHEIISGVAQAQAK